MEETKFRQIIVIGYGKIARDILQYVHQNQEKYEYGIFYIEHETYPFCTAAKYAAKNGIIFRMISDKKELLQFFLEMKDKTLIISANNNFIFPSVLIEKRNLTIINFHNALLPAFPGRNAPSWAIFEGCKESGITWHYVTEGIDAGDIIIQKRCEISVDMRAYELANILMQLALKGFMESFSQILAEDVQVKSQGVTGIRKIYKSSEVPGEARFMINDSPEYIYRLLRSVDYGKNRIFPVVTTKYKGNEIAITRYKRIMTRGDMKTESESLYLYMEDDTLLKLKYTFI